MDIVERLRREEDALDNEAADEIEQLQLALGAMISAYDHAWEVGDAVVRCRKIMADGQKPWDEIERLNEKIKEQADEIERLREQERKMTNHALERMEEIERLREALQTAESWIDRWTEHVGKCAGNEGCTCGRTLVLFECSSALQQKENA